MSNRLRMYRRVAGLAAGCALACALLGCGPEPEPPATFHPSTPAEAAALTYFTSTVKPILRSNCYRCHFGMNHKGDFNITNRALLLKGGKNGVDVIPGDPDASTLVKAIRHEGPGDHPMPMPPKDKLSDQEIAAIATWIKNGAVMDR
jgi:cytochrome c